MPHEIWLHERIRVCGRTDYVTAASISFPLMASFPPPQFRFRGEGPPPLRSEPEASGEAAAAGGHRPPIVMLAVATISPLRRTRRLPSAGSMARSRTAVTYS